MSTNKLILLGAAFILAWLLGAMPASAQVPPCDPSPITNPGGDCDGDLVTNEFDQCPATVVGEDLVVGACTIPGLDTILPTGCSLTEVLTDELAECEQGARNHGKYVSCVAKLTNALKKQKFITGAQKGQIQSCAAQTDIGK